MTISGSK